VPLYFILPFGVNFTVTVPHMMTEAAEKQLKIDD